MRFRHADVRFGLEIVAFPGYEWGMKNVDSFAERRKTAQAAKALLLEKYKTRPAEDDPAVIARAEARRAIEEARAVAAAKRAREEEARKVAEAEAAAAQALAEEAERVARIARQEAEAAAAKAKRDARYAARKQG